MAKKSGPPRRPLQLCVYCGNRPRETKDHVVPRGLFHTRDRHMITVPACAACNQSKQPGDAYLREYLVADHQGSKHPEAQRLFSGPVARAIERRQSRLAPQVSQASVVTLFVDGFWQDMAVVEVDAELVNTELSFIVRGLYFHEAKTRLPPEYEVKSVRLPQDHITTAMEWFAERLTGESHPRLRMLGNRVFWYVMVVDQDDPYVTGWLLCFYDRVFFMARYETGGRPGVGGRSRPPSRRSALRGRSPIPCRDF